MRAAKSELDTFDGLDNRREVMILLDRLGSDRARVEFIESLIPNSISSLAGVPMRVVGTCDPIRAYFMFVSVCNELRVPVDIAAKLLDERVRKMC